MDMEWSLDAVSSGFSIDNAITASKELFSESNVSFEEIKNRPWYKSLLNTVTFHRGDKKLMVRNVRNLASLQSLFIEIYITQLNNQDAQLDAIVQDIRSTQRTVEQLYCKCVLNLKPQEDIGSLVETDQQILLLLLSEFDRTRCLTEAEREKLQEYNSAVAQALYLNRPNGALEPEQLELVQEPVVFYRCILEQCAVTGRLNPLCLPENIEEAVDYLDISGRKKKEAQASVQAELDDYGKGWFLQKYSKPGSILDERDFVFALDEPEEPEELPEAAADEGSDNPMDVLAWVVDVFTSDRTLGAPQLQLKSVQEKNQLIAQLLPDVLPVSKAVLEITKLKNSYLIFTTCALYYIKSDHVARIPYAAIDKSCVGTRATDGGTAFVYAPPYDNSVEISDPELDAEALENLLIMVSDIKEFPEGDTLMEFSELPIGLRVAYLQILVGILQENNLPVHEIFRIAVRRDMETYWSSICEGPEMPMEDAIRSFLSSIPYPNEEALTVSLLQDLCIAYQYTKDSDVLTAEEKTYFSLICGMTDSNLGGIVRYAQMEKQMIEGRIDAKEAKETSDAFNIAVGAVGASVLTYAGAMGLFTFTLWFNFIPGIGTLISAGIAGAAIAKKYLSAKRDTSVSDAQVRQEMKVTVMDSYKKSEEAAQILGDETLLSGLRESALKIASRIDYRYTEYTSEEVEALDGLRKVIRMFIEEERVKKLPAMLAEDLSDAEKEDLVSNMTFPNTVVSTADIIGVYRSLLDNRSGFLFMRDCFYFRKGKASPIQQMSYHDLLSVEDKLIPPSILIHGRSGNNLSVALPYDIPAIKALMQQIIGALATDAVKLP